MDPPPFLIYHIQNPTEYREKNKMKGNYSHTHAHTHPPPPLRRGVQDSIHQQRQLQPITLQHISQTLAAAPWWTIGNCGSQLCPPGRRLQRRVANWWGMAGGDGGWGGRWSHDPRGEAGDEERLPQKLTEGVGTKLMTRGGTTLPPSFTSCLHSTITSCLPSATVWPPSCSLGGGSRR